MRPLRFILLLTFFVALPVFLTCWSLFSTHENPAETFRTGYTTETSRLRALFSFSTPSTLFPPSAVISLTNDNSTFFLARPAAFGPSLPTKGLSGQLWVGRGFGDESAFEDDGVHISGWELGCSDVPGWRKDERKRLEKLAAIERPQKRSVDTQDHKLNTDTSEDQLEQSHDDGTDDYLHSPLPDSNPATPGKPGEPASVDHDKGKKPTHADIESLQESADIAGKVVLLARGGCGFLEKVKWAQRRGGVAVIVGEREKGGSLTIMYAKGDVSNVTIPAIFTSYNAAHLLSTLVPDKDLLLEEKAKQLSDSKSNKAADKPIFTSTSASPKPTSVVGKAQPGLMQDALAVMGLGENSPWHAEDSRRPPGSGNIEWVLQEDWDEDDQIKTKPNALVGTSARLSTSPTMSTKVKATSTKRSGDDFVIGVQDWRDTELIAHKPTMNSNVNAQNGKPVSRPSPLPGAKKPVETALKGGSITPGSGEYDHDQTGKAEDNPPDSKNQQHSVSRDRAHQDGSKRGWFSFFAKKPCSDMHSHPEKPQSKSSMRSPSGKLQEEEEEQEGLWVTLTPTSVSTSPFFDTLLVLVVSPLVTLTVVYALLLLRSRIRRRRWRAPKSVVERLPVRTYHTMSATSSTTSSQVPSPDHSAAASPLLQATSPRPRPRSQTTTGVLATSQDSALSLPPTPRLEKPKSKAGKRKRYTGRQLECVVCLEDYVDGESRVMSLPCGHEFHADCITPWLVNRRRTCPICKGDVVRSMARANHNRLILDQRQDGEQTSDDVQSRVAQTINEEATAAIPIPPRDEDSEDEDIERGQDIDEPLLGGQASGQQSAWRNVIARSLSRLSGDTIFRQTPTGNDRSR